MKVVNLDSETTVDQLKTIFLENPDCIFIHYYHQSPLKKGENLITEARGKKESYDLLITLANHGFYLYMTKENRISSFVHHSELPRLWNPVRSGEYQYSEAGLVYSLEVPELYKPRNLLVIFSSMNGPIYMSSLMRMFTQNYKTISKYISPDTAILRIADVGGVLGSYYMNTNYLNNNEDNISNLILKIKIMVGVEKVVLMGGSKGGSAALMYSIKDNYSCIAVDPILSDEHYKNDSHFTEKILLVPKHEKFKDILSVKDWSDDIDRHVITAVNSPQLRYINDILIDRYGNHFKCYLNNNMHIKSHPDVAPYSIHLVSSLLNLSLNSIPILKGNYDFV